MCGLGPEAFLQRAVVVAESPLLRAGLASLVAAIPGLTLTAEREGLDSTSLAALGGADLVLWDVADTMAGDRAKEVAAALATIFLVGSPARLPELVGAGARGVLWRDVDPERLTRAVSAVLAGATVLDEGMGPLLLERKAAEGSSVDLTPRELEVLGLMAEGLSNKLIAARLGISDHTAKFHVNAVLEKLGAETRTEAVVRAARQGLLML